MKKLNIKQKLFLLLAFPLVALLLFSAKGFFEQIHNYSEMSEVEELAIFSTKISNFVHEMQKERGATAVYMGSNGSKYNSEVNSQRTDTDHALKVLNAFLSNFNARNYGAEFDNNLKGIIISIGKLDSIRTKATDLRISANETIAYYTSSNAQSLNIRL